MSFKPEIVSGLLDHLSSEISSLEQKLAVYLDKDLLEKEVAQRDGVERAEPYALVAYALGSLLFAYFRSEGEDKPEALAQIERVKKCFEAIEDAKKNGPKRKKLPPQPDGGSKSAKRKPKKKKLQ